MQRLDLYAMPRESQLKREGYSANVYLSVLDDNLFRIYDPGLTFMQDNAPIHTTEKTGNGAIKMV